jgi:hypothetical protein
MKYNGVRVPTEYATATDACSSVWNWASQGVTAGRPAALAAILSTAFSGRV